MADASAREIPVELEVLALSDGVIAGRRGIYAGRTALLGPTAAVRVGGLTMVGVGAGLAVTRQS